MRWFWLKFLLLQFIIQSQERLGSPSSFSFKVSHNTDHYGFSSSLFQHFNSKIFYGVKPSLPSCLNYSDMISKLHQNREAIISHILTQLSYWSNPESISDCYITFLLPHSPSMRSVIIRKRLESSDFLLLFVSDANSHLHLDFENQFGTVEAGHLVEFAHFEKEQGMAPQPLQAHSLIVEGGNWYLVGPYFHVLNYSPLFHMLSLAKGDAEEIPPRLRHCGVTMSSQFPVKLCISKTEFTWFKLTHRRKKSSIGSELLFCDHIPLFIKHSSISIKLKLHYRSIDRVILNTLHGVVRDHMCGSTMISVNKRSSLCDKVESCRTNSNLKAKTLIQTLHLFMKHCRDIVARPITSRISMPNSTTTSTELMNSLITKANPNMNVIIQLQQ
ncbi:uncharacterized protein G2W53_015509 [Senna tora]|uniref:Uncharacterized protein n=1 Tax=Senna tora TaxID=362788 RepID=A0A835C878_9FABA|nr:uncharacterized protein G2W53_015509 [Senna tora]